MHSTPNLLVLSCGVSSGSLLFSKSNCYTMGCPPVRGDNPRALASGLSYVQVDNPWYNYFMPYISVDLAHREIIRA